MMNIQHGNPDEIFFQPEGMERAFWGMGLDSGIFELECLRGWGAAGDE
jgi:hypothetical protein